MKPQLTRTDSRGKMLRVRSRLAAQRVREQIDRDEHGLTSAGLLHDLHRDERRARR